MPTDSPKFVDLHTHVLPGLDDGARSLEESLLMLRDAAVDGTCEMVATPHHNDVFRNDAASSADHVQSLQHEAGSKVKIHSGCEVTIDPDSLQAILEAPEMWTINRTRYVLVEFPPTLAPRLAGRVLSEILNGRLTPIVAHPERMPAFRDDLDTLQSWCRNGAALQVTAGSLDQRFGSHAQQAAMRMVRAGLVTIVASDSHDTVKRPPSLLSAWRRLATEFGDSFAAQVLSVNPGRVVRGESFDTIPARPRTRGLRRFFSWAS